MKSAFSSYPALYFPDYSRALRAAGDEVGANRMLNHLEGVVELHNELFVGFRNQPRFVALVERIRRELSRQRDELSRVADASEL